MPVIVVACRRVATPERGFAPVIDLHCHILPGARRRGARPRATALGWRAQAAADGIEAICATPHIRHDHDVRIDEVAGRVEVVNARLREEGVPVVVLQGGEVAETAVEDLSEEELARLALGGGRWVLLEPAPGPLGDSLRAPCRAPRRARPPGADRPPRAPPLRRHVRAHRRRWSATGRWSRRPPTSSCASETAAGMRALAEAGLVHVLSSDAHSSQGGRPVRLAAAFERAARGRARSRRTSSGCGRPPRARSSRAASSSVRSARPL